MEQAAGNGILYGHDAEHGAVAAHGAEKFLERRTANQLDFFAGEVLVRRHVVERPLDALYRYLFHTWLYSTKNPASSGSGMIAIFFLVSSFDVCTQRPASPFSKVVKVKAKRCKVAHNASFLGHYLWQKYNYISRKQTFRQIFLRFCPKTPLRHASCGPSRRSLAAARQETVERFPQVGA